MQRKKAGPGRTACVLIGVIFFFIIILTTVLRMAVPVPLAALTTVMMMMNDRGGDDHDARSQPTSPGWAPLIHDAGDDHDYARLRAGFFVA